MGSEGEGVSRLVREACDFECRLPQRGSVESLNVAQATTVLAIGHINVSNMRVFRSAKNETAVMIVCTDSPVPNEIVHMIQNITAIESVVTLLPL